MTTSAQVRNKLVTALQLDLVGPSYDDVDYRHEILPQSPTAWYLTGFLAPNNAPINLRSDDTGDDELDQINGNNNGDDEATPEKTAARKGFFPASMGLSCLVSPETTNLDLIIEWGDYIPEADSQTSLETPLQQDTSRQWQRIPQQRRLTLDLDFNNEKQINIAESDGLKIVINSRRVNCDHLVPPNTRAISVFLVNDRHPSPDQERDLSFIFQASITIHCDTAFVPRPNLKGQNTDDPDEKIADLQYRDDYEYVVGHNVSAIAYINPDGSCQKLQTAWIPQAEVEKVIAAPLERVELGMEAIAEAPNADTVRQMIGNMVTAYTEWIG